MPDRIVHLNPQQRKAVVDNIGSPVYLLFIDLRSSVGGGFKPLMYQSLVKLAKQWGTAGTSMQHWALMVDNHVYELARKPDWDNTVEEGMPNNSGFRRPRAIPYDEWERERQVKEVKWRQYQFTKRNKGDITRIAQEIATDMQRYNGLENNCQHFVTRLYDRLGCGRQTGAGWAVMSSEILPKQIPITATMASVATDDLLSIALSGFMTLLLLAQV